MASSGLGGPLCVRLPNFSDLTLVGLNWLWREYCTSEFGRCYKSGLPLPLREPVVRPLPARQRTEGIPMRSLPSSAASLEAGAQCRATSPAGCMAAPLIGLAVPGREGQYLRGRRPRLTGWMHRRVGRDPRGEHRGRRGGGQQSEEEEASRAVGSLGGGH